VRARQENFTRRNGQPLADLMSEEAELERRLDAVRLSLQAELSEPLTGGPEQGLPGDPDLSADWRTDTLVNRGRHGTARSGLPGLPSLPGLPAVSRWLKIVILSLAVVVVAVLVIMNVTSSGPSWPASVATMESQISKACQNPDVRSAPTQVNFACAPATRSVLWVFALVTSGGNPYFNDTSTGRLGLEPIAPRQGGQVSWTLNLHHPYNPFNPVDSLQVAARAINSIIGGATLTSSNGNPVVQPGLESKASNCRRYTGSPEVTKRQGMPGICAQPVSSLAGQAALVKDVFRKWVVGADPQTARDAAVLFEHANDPGSQEVQSILRRMPNLKPSA
jgi:hypothetical protein